MQKEFTNLKEESSKKEQSLKKELIESNENLAVVTKKNDEINKESEKLKELIMILEEESNSDKDIFDLDSHIQN